MENHFTLSNVYGDAGFFPCFYMMDNSWHIYAGYLFYGYDLMW